MIIVGRIIMRRNLSFCRATTDVFNEFLNFHSKTRTQILQDRLVMFFEWLSNDSNDSLWSFASPRTNQPQPTNQKTIFCNRKLRFQTNNRNHITPCKNIPFDCNLQLPKFCSNSYTNNLRTNHRTRRKKNPDLQKRETKNVHA